MQRIVILASNTLKGRALAASWACQRDSVVLGHAAELPEAIRLIRDLKPSLVVIDPDSPRLCTAHAVALIRRQRPQPQLHLGMPLQEGTP